MEELLANIQISVSEYHKLGDRLEFEDTQTLSVLLKDLSANLFYLEKYRDDYSRKFNTIMHLNISQGNAVSKAEIIAKEQVPELYMLRRLMTSGYKVVEAIRSNISFLKNEK